MKDASREAFYKNLKAHEKDELQVVRALKRIGADFEHITDQKEQHYGDVYLRNGKIYIEIKIDELATITDNVYFEIAEVFTDAVTSNWNPESITTIGFPKHAAKRPTIFLHRIGKDEKAPWLVYSAAALLDYVLNHAEKFNFNWRRDPFNQGKINLGVILKGSFEALLDDEDLKSIFYVAYDLNAALTHVKTIFTKEPLLRRKTNGNPLWRLVNAFGYGSMFERRGWLYYDLSIGGEPLIPRGLVEERRNSVATELWLENDRQRLTRIKEEDMAWARAMQSMGI